MVYTMNDEYVDLIDSSFTASAMRNAPLQNNKPKRSWLKRSRNNKRPKILVRLRYSFRCVHNSNANVYLPSFIYWTPFYQFQIKNTLLCWFLLTSGWFMTFLPSYSQAKPMVRQSQCWPAPTNQTPPTRTASPPTTSSSAVTLAAISRPPHLASSRSSIHSFIYLLFHLFIPVMQAGNEHFWV